MIPAIAKRFKLASTNLAGAPIVPLVTTGSGSACWPRPRPSAAGGAATAWSAGQRAPSGRTMCGRRRQGQPCRGEAGAAGIENGIASARCRRTRPGRWPRAFRLGSYRGPAQGRAAAGETASGCTGSLQVCVQVNVDGGPNKSGVVPEEALELARAVAAPAAPASARPDVHSRAEPRFRTRLRGVRPRARIVRSAPGAGLELDTLSMGMSDDLEAAVASGSTMVRVGSAIFGARHYPAG